jgi:hypothetical protein
MSELPTVPCPVCAVMTEERKAMRGVGLIFEDARGGFECTCCDARFLIARQAPDGYGGPGGPLSWNERHAEGLDRWGWALSGATGAALAEARWLTGGVLGAASFALLLAASSWKITWRVP